MLINVHSDCEHGQIFDNRKRWCGNCNKAVATGTDLNETDYLLSGKKCHVCSALWPEYVDEFLEGFLDDPLYQVLFGIGETIH